jgi:hypothetical protein
MVELSNHFEEQPRGGLAVDGLLDPRHAREGGLIGNQSGAALGGLHLCGIDEQEGAAGGVASLAMACQAGGRSHLCPDFAFKIAAAGRASLRRGEFGRAVRRLSTRERADHCEDRNAPRKNVPTMKISHRPEFLATALPHRSGSSIP